MDFRFDAEQEELRAIARAFLADHAGSEAVRKAMESELGFDPCVDYKDGALYDHLTAALPEAIDVLRRFQAIPLT